MLTPEQRAFKAEVDAFLVNVHEVIAEARRLQRRVKEQERRLRKLDGEIRGVAKQKGVMSVEKDVKPKGS